MAWRLAQSLVTLRAQVDKQFPGRSKLSDGSIGDEKHSARTSDHNPDDTGVVRAIDITHDPRSGLDSRKLADLILAKQDPRLKYVISFNRIGSGPAGPSPGKWREYKTPPNKNPHDHHCHVSVTPKPKTGPDRGDDPAPWDLGQITVKPQPEALAPYPVVKPGGSNDDVAALQKALGVTVTGKYAPNSETEFALKLFQIRNNLVPDGIAGPQTWKALATIRLPG